MFSDAVKFSKACHGSDVTPTTNICSKAVDPRDQRDGSPTHREKEQARCSNTRSLFEVGVWVPGS